ncbi:MAG TPA: hypothetical protein VGM67_18090 [Gemmatimonadaceae bacterium]|jgi:hypothetical protein
MDQSERLRRRAERRRAIAQRCTAYAEAVARLTPEAWSRLEVACASLDDPSAAALVERALLFAKSHELYTPEPLKGRAFQRAIRGALRVYVTGLALAYEVGAEFEPAFPDEVRPRTKSSGSPDIDAMVDARQLVESTLVERHAVHPLGPGLIAAVRLGEGAVARHDMLPPESFAAVYRFMEPEIPYSSLLPQ